MQRPLRSSSSSNDDDDDGDLSAIVRAAFSLSAKPAMPPSPCSPPPLLAPPAPPHFSPISSLRNSTPRNLAIATTHPGTCCNMPFSSSLSTAAPTTAITPNAMHIATTPTPQMPMHSDAQMMRSFHNISYGGHFLKQTHEAARPPLSPSSFSFTSSSSLSSPSSASSSYPASIRVMKTKETKRRGCKSGNGSRKAAAVKRVIHVPSSSSSSSTAAAGESASPSNPTDMWAWRKYGQKPIKGSPYPRGYYRCSSSKGCPARKQVERSVTDPNMLVVSYTSEHNHSWPQLTSRALPPSRSKEVQPALSPTLQDTKSPCSINTSDFSSEYNADVVYMDDDNDDDDDANDGHGDSHDSLILQSSDGKGVSGPPSQQQPQQQQQTDSSAANNECADFLLHDALFAEMLEEMQGQEWSMEGAHVGLPHEEVDPFKHLNWSSIGSSFLSKVNRVLQ